MAMTQEELNQLAEQVGTKGAEKFEKMRQDFEAGLNKKAADLASGLISKTDFEKFQADGLKPINDHLKSLEDAMKEQGAVIKTLSEKGGGGDKPESLESVLGKNIDSLKSAYNNRGGAPVQFDLKAAAITSIGNTIGAQTNVPTSPYAPGIGGPDLTLYDIMQNPAYITSKVNLGRTNQSRIAWINETSVQGSPGLVLEGAQKPLTQHTFQVELSIAKKIAAYIVLTEEFQDDLPYLATQVRQLLMNDLLRFFDNQIQTDVIANAVGFVTPNPATGAIANATLWDAILAGYAQVQTANYQPNSVGLNPWTNLKLQTVKDSQGRYNWPPFAQDVDNDITLSNKVYPNMAFVGDLKQFNVLLYKEAAATVGWQNDDFIRNQFTVVAEMRFHDFISTARKPAIVYYNLATARTNINGNGS